MLYQTAVYAVESLLRMRASVLGSCAKRQKNKPCKGGLVGCLKPYQTHSQRLVVKRNVE